MKIVTYNVNGVRSAIAKGFLDWLKTEDPDVVCLQEIKLFETDLVQPQFEALGYCCNWFPAQKKGYSGVAILSKETPKNVAFGCGNELFDFEGRVIRADFETCSVMSVYFPSGSAGDERQAVKMDFLTFFQPYIHVLKQNISNLIIVGDYNICHEEIDIHNPKANKNSSGFLPEEREWLGKMMESGFVDAFRVLNAEPHNYTWWSVRFKAKEKNLGWRIDYQLISETIAHRLKKSSIQPQLSFSDHCPVLIEMEGLTPT